MVKFESFFFVCVWGGGGGSTYLWSEIQEKNETRQNLSLKTAIPEWYDCPLNILKPQKTLLTRVDLVALVLLEAGQTARPSGQFTGQLSQVYNPLLLTHCGAKQNKKNSYYTYFQPFMHNVMVIIFYGIILSKCLNCLTRRLSQHRN